MLKPVGNRPAIVVCSTCRFRPDQRDNEDGVRGGALFTQAMREAAGDEFEVQEMPCLFACAQHCVVHLRAEGKIGYVLGRFEPTGDSARAVVDYFRSYTESAEGIVPYKDWPEGVKGHFLVRVPPGGFVTD